MARKITRQPKILPQSDPPPSKNADFDRSPLITSPTIRDSEKFNYDE